MAKGKPFTLLAGAVVVILGATLAQYWEAIYFRLVPEALSERLGGRNVGRIQAEP